jgi:hypothetical protein
MANFSKQVSINTGAEGGRRFIHVRLAGIVARGGHCGSWREGVVLVLLLLLLVVVERCGR